MLAQIYSLGDLSSSCYFFLNSFFRLGAAVKPVIEPEYHIYGAPVNIRSGKLDNLEHIRSGSWRPSLLPAVLRHTGGTFCKLPREFCSSPDELQLGWRRHRRTGTGDSSRDWTSSRSFPHWTDSPLTKARHTIHDWDLWMGWFCGRPDWQMCPLWSSCKHDIDIEEKSGFIQGVGGGLSRTSSDLHSHGWDKVLLQCWSSWRTWPTINLGSPECLSIGHIRIFFMRGFIGMGWCLSIVHKMIESL